MIALKKKFFLIFTTSLFLILPFSQSFSQESIFIVDDVKIEAKININFSREKYFNKAFLDSFKLLMSQVLLSKDLNKIKNVKLNKIRNLISSFQVLEETYKKDKYKASIRIFYNEPKVKRFLAEQNISFSQPKNISAVFFPVLFVDDELQDFDDNYFYNQWTKVKVKNESINFILPIEDLDDISMIKKMRNSIEEINVDSFVHKYNTKNYAFVFMNHFNKELNIHIKTNFDENEMSKNISYKINNIKDKKELNSVLRDLKIQIIDLWKETNVVNLLMPLSIKIKFKQSSLQSLDELKKTFLKISIIDNYMMEEFNTKNSLFKIYYFGNPKKLKSELLKFGYQLKNDQGYWELYFDG